MTLLKMRDSLFVTLIGETVQINCFSLFSVEDESIYKEYRIVTRVLVLKNQIGYRILWQDVSRRRAMRVCRVQ